MENAVHFLVNQQVSAHFRVSAGRQGGWGAGRLLAFTEWRKLNLYPLLYQGVWASQRMLG